MERDPDLLLSIVALIVVAATVLVAVVQTWRTRPRRPREGPPTMDLLDEPPPAIVDLVTDDFEVTPEAVPATLCDLAARRWISIEEMGYGNVVIRLGRRDGRGELLDYEQQVLDHMRRLAIDGIVPAKAMTTGPEAVSSGWWTRFRRAVVADGQRRGLCRDRWSVADLAPVAVGAVLAALVLWIANLAGDERPSHVEMTRDAVIASVLFAAGIVGVGALLWWLGRTWRSGAQRETDRGLQVATHWLGVRRWMADVGDFGDKPAASVTLWERYLGYAVALDLARTATVQLPLGAEDDRHAWSRVTGQWRPVTVRYPRRRPGWGMHPVWAALQSIVVGGLAVVGVWAALQVRFGRIDAVRDLSDRARNIAELVALGVAAVLVPVVAWSAVKLVRGVLDLFDTRTAEGEILRRRRRRSGDWIPSPVERVVYSGRNQAGRSRDSDRKERLYVAVDTGWEPTIRAWAVPPQVFGRCHQGDAVRVRYTPRLGRVKSLEVLRSAAPPTAPAAVPDAAMAAAAADFLGRVVGGAKNRIAAAAGPEALDAVDRDGVTLRDRLAHAEAMLDQLRQGRLPDSDGALAEPTERGPT